MTILTEKQVMARLKARQAGRSLRVWSLEVGISHSHLHDVLKGRRTIGPTILKYLSLRKDEMAVYRVTRKAKS